MLRPGFQSQHASFCKCKHSAFSGELSRHAQYGRCLGRTAGERGFGLLRGRKQAELRTANPYLI